jgi:hypothetical protein
MKVMQTVGLAEILHRSCTIWQRDFLGIGSEPQLGFFSELYWDSPMSPSGFCISYRNGLEKSGKKKCKDFLPLITLLELLSSADDAGSGAG